MPARVPDIPTVATLTVGEAVSLLSRQAADARVVIAFLVESTFERPTPQPRLRRKSPVRCRRRAPKRRRSDLILLRKQALDHIPELVTFYLIGRAYQTGQTSLREVAAEFRRRLNEGTLPDGINVSVSHLSDTIHDLEEAVFASYLHKPAVSLTYHPRGEGNAATFNGDGWIAWEATRDFLDDYYERPAW